MNLDDGPLRKYLSRCGGRRSFRREFSGRKFRNAVVIPAYAELDFLPATLRSLAGNPPELLRETLVAVVVNNPPCGKCDPAKFAENRRLLEILDSDAELNRRLNLGLVDASAPGLEVPEKDGVGGARKIGMDLSLCFLDWESDPLIFSLDADTIVEGNYLGEVVEHFRSNPDSGGAVIAFSHQPGRTRQEDAAVKAYELFMRCYAEGLRLAASPYAYHSLGSAFAVRAREYVRAGGMRRRRGGEDFYFLQALRKIAGIGFAAGTCVHPSARASDRVPFGTGPELSLLSKGKELKAFNPAVFKVLGAILRGACLESLGSAEAVRRWLVSLPEEAAEFLESERFMGDWPKILENTPRRETKIRWAFHTWFDALKTLQFIHFCEIRRPEKYPRLLVEDAAAALAAMGVDARALRPC